MKRPLAILILLFITLTVFSQTEKDYIYHPMNEGTLIGAGSSNIKDTYLSPFNYSGWGIRILNERMKVIGIGDSKFSRQQLINVDISSTTNPAENVDEFGGFVDYSLAYHYRMKPSSKMKILVGAAGHVMGGFIYNTRNSNNPFSAKVDLDLNLSALAIYNTRIKKLPLTFRYQVEIPVMGMFFMPNYGESYYEIFNAGNTSNVVGLSSFHNKFAIKNYFTVDIPCKSFTIRTGYLNSLYYSEAKSIDVHIISNSFMIGWVKEFISLGGKRNRHSQKYQSPFY